MDHGSWLDWKKNGVVGVRLGVNQWTASVGLKFFSMGPHGMSWKDGKQIQVRMPVLEVWEVVQLLVMTCYGWDFSTSAPRLELDSSLPWEAVPVRGWAASLASTHEMPVALLQWWQPKASSDIVKHLLRGQQSSQVENHCQMIAHRSHIDHGGYYEAWVTEIRIRNLWSVVLGKIIPLAAVFSFLEWEVMVSNPQVCCQELIM